MVSDATSTVLDGVGGAEDVSATATTDAVDRSLADLPPSSGADSVDAGRGGVTTADALEDGEDGVQTGNGDSASGDAAQTDSVGTADTSGGDSSANDATADAGCTTTAATCNAPPAACKTTTQGKDACGAACSKTGPAKCFKVHPACITSGPGTLTDAAECTTPYGKYNCGLSCQAWPNDLGADCAHCVLVKCVKKAGKDEAQFKCKNLPVAPTP